MNERTNQLHTPRTMHLFSGAGGGLLADLLLGHQPVCAVEIDNYCQQVLDARQKDGTFQWFPIFNDVTAFDGNPWCGLVDIVAGGFPCQDISIAGKGAGLDGSHSGLWSEFARIVGEVRPIHAFIENSPMLLTRGLDRVLCDLAALGYDASWGVVSAADVGAPHKRERIWILATDTNSQRRDERLGDGQKRHVLYDKERDAQKTESAWHEWVSGSRQVGADDANTNGAGLQGQEWGGLLRAQGRAEPSGYSAHWNTVKPPVLGVVDGVANQLHRLKCIGNGQCPQSAALAFDLLGKVKK